jgi:hypothetical protein
VSSLDSHVDQLGREAEELRERLYDVDCSRLSAEVLAARPINA